MNNMNTFDVSKIKVQTCLYEHIQTMDINMFPKIMKNITSYFGTKEYTGIDKEHATSEEWEYVKNFIQGESCYLIEKGEAKISHALSKRNIAKQGPVSYEIYKTDNHQHVFMWIAEVSLSKPETAIIIFK